ncbi:unnamed protein product [Nesidiocoris tenuis]|uniref:Uncharacterized protein n=1 Tax=Nesidiocoris tenuis TaxID=355587 RepID=A0A6H5H0V9_9HEMI|nr:unnamed protein product [Nesidiocoris tenuis]
MKSDRAMVDHSSERRRTYASTTQSLPIPVEIDWQYLRPIPVKITIPMKVRDNKLRYSKYRKPHSSQKRCPQLESSSGRKRLGKIRGAGERTRFARGQGRNAQGPQWYEHRDPPRPD